MHRQQKHTVIAALGRSSQSNLYTRIITITLTHSCHHHFHTCIFTSQPLSHAHTLIARTHFTLPPPSHQHTYLTTAITPTHITTTLSFIKRETVPFVFTPYMLCVMGKDLNDPRPKEVRTSASKHTIGPPITRTQT